MAENKSETTRIHCNVCLNETNHVNLLTRRQDGSAPYDEQYDISWSTIYDVFECCGCESVTMRRRHYFSEWNHGDHELDFYPPRIGRRIPDWKSKLSSEMQHLMDEVYAALQADSRSLAMMGARALIDMVIVDKVGDAGSFAQKLKKLESEGFLSEKNRNTLDVALEVGNAASHRGHRPKNDHVQSVMDIVENLLQSTILETVTDEIRDATPKRKPATSAENDA